MSVDILFSTYEHSKILGMIGMLIKIRLLLRLRLKSRWGVITATFLFKTAKEL